MSTATLDSPPVAPPAEDTKFSRILRWRNGEKLGPWELQVHPTNRCNLKCKICWERRAEKEIGMSIYDRSVEVPDERYLRLVDEAAALGVREWTIVGGGEPMVRDELVISMCERIHGHGMKAALHTNGTRFKQSHFERLIEAGLDHIRVSVDGPTAELNDAIRSGGFEKVLNNFRLLKEMKRAAGVDKPTVTLHPVIANITYQRLDEIVELAHDLGAIGLGLGMLNFERPDEEGAIFLLSEEQQAELPYYIKKAQLRAHELGILEEFDALLPSDERSTHAKPMLGRTCCGDGRMTDAACFEVWLTAVIHVTGQLGPCCVSFDPRADNIQELSFHDAWFGPFMEETRRRIVTQSLQPFCAGCHRTYIEPRSERIRHQLVEVIPRSERAQWDKWAGLSLSGKLALLASRSGTHLKRHGLRHTLQRASEWLQIHR